MRAAASVIEQNARAGEHTVGFAVFLGDPEPVLLGDGVGAVGVERGLFVLRDLLNLAVQLGRRSLVDAAGVRQAAQAHGLQHAQHAGGVDVGRELRHIEADLHMALGGQVVDLVRPHAANDREQAHRIAHIAIVQVEIRVALQVGDPLAVIDRRPADDAVHVVALAQQKLGQVAAVLPGDAGDQRFFHGRKLLYV